MSQFPCTPFLHLSYHCNKQITWDGESNMNFTRTSVIFNKDMVWILFVGTLVIFCWLLVHQTFDLQGPCFDLEIASFQLFVVVGRPGLFVTLICIRHGLGRFHPVTVIFLVTTHFLLFTCTLILFSILHYFVTFSSPSILVTWLLRWNLLLR